jgi:hypothetical protein
MSLDTLPFNWFDLVILIVVFVGVAHGRKQGISEELLGVLQWLVIMLGCALLYRPLGEQLSASSVFSLLSSYLMAYLGVALAIAFGFTFLKKGLGGKLVGSDAFGRSEFYLGMIGGVVKFSCILIVGLALLNARAYNAVEIKADISYQNDVYGNTFFPKLYNVQAQVFEHSLTGPWIRDNLGSLLIKSTAPQQKDMKRKDYALP